MLLNMTEDNENVRTEAKMYYDGISLANQELEMAAHYIDLIRIKFSDEFYGEIKEGKNPFLEMLANILGAEKYIVGAKDTLHAAKCEWWNRDINKDQVDVP